jgi:hypothetical protein
MEKHVRELVGEVISINLSGWGKVKRLWENTDWTDIPFLPRDVDTLIGSNNSSKILETLKTVRQRKRNNMTVIQLRQLACQLELKGYQSMNRSDLLKVIGEYYDN